MSYRTRQQMEAIVARGASVMMPDGRVATAVDQLPSESTLARWDAEHADKIKNAPGADEAMKKLADTLSRAAEEREAKAREELKAQIAGLQAQLDEAGVTKAPAEPAKVAGPAVAGRSPTPPPASPMGTASVASGPAPAATILPPSGSPATTAPAKAEPPKSEKK